jgi:WD40 domain-containing protein
MVRTDVNPVLLKCAVAVVVLLRILGSGMAMLTGRTPSRAAQPEKAPPEAARPSPGDAHGDPLPASAFRRLGTERLRHGGGIRSIVWLQDGQWLASGGGFSDYTVRLWDATTGKQIRQFDKHQAAVSSLAVTPDGALTASVDRYGTLFVWETATSRVLSQSRLGEFVTVTFAGDGKTFAAIDEQGRACLFHTPNGQVRRAFQADGWNMPPRPRPWPTDNAPSAKPAAVDRNRSAKSWRLCWLAWESVRYHQHRQRTRTSRSRSDARGQNAF